MNPVHSFDVVIIGAGASGISAANQIKKSQHSYIVLEAQNRIGGRTKSITFDGVTMDEGASWLHNFRGNPKHPLLPLVKKHNIQQLKVSNVTEVDRIYDVEEKILVPKEVREKSLKLCQQFYRKGMEVAEKNDQDLSEEEAGKKVLDAIEKMNPIVRRCAHAFINESENAEASSIGELSAAEYDYDYEEYTLDEDEDWLPAGGYGNFMVKLAEGLNIELNKEVVSINRTQENVFIECSDGSTYKCFSALVSIPLAVLKTNRVKFSPPLPKKHQRAIQNLGVGLMNKVLLSFEENFWGPCLWFTMASDERGRFTHSANFSHNGKHILCSFMTGDFARKMQGRSDEEVINAALEMMIQIFGEERVKLREGHVTRWQNDPFALGSYTALHVGSCQKDFRNLRKPVDKQIWLIGEHVSEDLGSAHGAWEVGKEAAEEVVENL